MFAYIKLIFLIILTTPSLLPYESDKEIIITDILLIRFFSFGYKIIRSGFFRYLRCK